MIKKLLPYLMILAGPIIIVGSFVIGSLLGFGIIPDQDPTPEQAARQSAEDGILQIAILTGLGIFVIGIIWALIRMVIWMFKRRA